MTHTEAARAILRDLDARAAELKAQGNMRRDDLNEARTDMQISLQAAQVHATLALVEQVAALVARG